MILTLTLNDPNLTLTLTLTLNDPDLTLTLTLTLNDPNLTVTLTLTLNDPNLTLTLTLKQHSFEKDSYFDSVRFTKILFKLIVMSFIRIDPFHGSKKKFQFTGNS